MDRNLDNEIQALQKQGKSQDEILGFLFSKAFSITDAIVAIRRLYGIKLDEAKRIVASSHYWQSVNSSNHSLHDALEKAASTTEAKQK